MNAISANGLLKHFIGSSQVLNRLDWIVPAISALMSTLVIGCVLFMVNALVAMTAAAPRFGWLLLILPLSLASFQSVGHWLSERGLSLSSEQSIGLICTLCVATGLALVAATLRLVLCAPLERLIKDSPESANSSLDSSSTRWVRGLRKRLTGVEAKLALRRLRSASTQSPGLLRNARLLSLGLPFGGPGVFIVGFVALLLGLVAAALDGWVFSGNRGWYLMNLLVVIVVTGSIWLTVRVMSLRWDDWLEALWRLSPAGPADINSRRAMALMLSWRFSSMATGACLGILCWPLFSQLTWLLVWPQLVWVWIVAGLAGASALVALTYRLPTRFTRLFVLFLPPLLMVCLSPGLDSDGLTLRSPVWLTSIGLASAGWVAIAIRQWLVKTVPLD